jgi:hypothetical protein
VVTVDGIDLKYEIESDIELALRYCGGKFRTGCAD